MAAKGIIVHKNGDTWVVSCMINLVSQYFSAVKLDLKSALEQLDQDQDWKEIRVDMKQSDMLDSSGIGILVSLYKRYAKKKKGFRVINCNEFVCDTLRLCNLYEVFQVNQVEEPKKETKKEPDITRTSFFLVKYIEGSWFFSLQVDLNISNVATMRKELIEVFKEKHGTNTAWTDLIFDLEKIQTIDSASIGVLLGVYRRTKAVGKKFKIIGCNPTIYELLRAIGVNQLFPIEKQV